ncbi:MAG: DNA polymerase III subunit delta' [Parcubacteria group bacterium]|nr:DNA polymerase III subunit delta' [Parcubacteria group bacterium]
MILLDNRIKTFLEGFFNPEIKQIQSLLFYGEENIGKRTTALTFAKGLLCQEIEKSFAGCEKCQSCLMFEKNLHPDFLLLEPLNDDTNIKIENVRQAIEFLYYKPQLSSWRLLIIDQADRLDENAQNTFLKTIEEPPPHTLIIFITSYPQKLLPTIWSRLMPIRFHRSSVLELSNFLVSNYQIDLKKAQEVSQLAHGKVGLAIKLLDSSYLRTVKNQRNSLNKLLKSDFTQQSKDIRNLYQDRNEVIATLKNWLDLLHSELQETNDTKRVKLAKELLKAFYLISESNTSSRLLLENIFLNYAH